MKRHHRAAAAMCAVFAIFGLAQGLFGHTYEWTTLAGSRGGPGFGDGPAGVAGFNRPAAVAADREGNLFLAEFGNHALRKITADGTVSTVAGKPGFPGSADGEGATARFNRPAGMAVADDGTIFVADTGNHTIRRIDPAGRVETIAGRPGVAGMIDGDGSEARFSSPAGLLSAADGSLLVADSGNHCIRRITADGRVETLAGSPGLAGHADGPPATARFHFPVALAADAAGAVFVADADSCTVRRIGPDGQVSTVAGAPYAYNHLDGVGTEAAFGYPTGIAVDGNGDVFVADAGSVTIRRIAAVGGMVTTLAGEVWEMGNADGTPGRFAAPAGMVFRDDGLLLVVDSENHALRSVSPHGEVGTVAASPPRESGSADGPGEAARFRTPMGVAAAPGGLVYVAETTGRTVRRISPDGVVSTLAGSPGLSGTDDGNGTDARFTSPRAITAGADGFLHVADVLSQSVATIRRISPAGDVSTLAGQPGSLPDTDTLYLPRGLATLANGDVVGTDISAVRRITPTGVVSFIAGSKRSFVHYDGGAITFWKSGSLNGTGMAASFFHPSGIAAVAGGDIFVAEAGGCVIRRITPAAVVSTIAGKALSASQTPEFRDGTGAAARFHKPEGLAADAAGNLYIADTGSHTIRKMNAAGVVTTIGGIPGYAGSAEGIGDRAAFGTPHGVSVDGEGNVYVTDLANHRIVKGRPLPLPAMAIEAADGTHLTTGAAPVDFGNVTVETAGAPRLLRVWNTGNAPLDLSDPIVLGGHGASFVIDRADLPAVLPPGAGGLLRIAAAPRQAGPLEATLRLAGNDPATPAFEVELAAFGNRLPVFSGYAASGPAATALTIPLAKLLARTHDPDGDSITVTAVAWPGAPHGSLALLADSIRFSPRNPGLSGSFTFLVTFTDARGGAATGTVELTMIDREDAASQSLTGNPPRITITPEGGASISFHGIPGRVYLIQRSTDLATWDDLATVVADAAGRIAHDDTSPPKPNAYYRLALP